MQFNYTLLSLTLTLCTTVSGMNIPYIHLLDTIDEIPSYYSQLATLLSNQISDFQADSKWRESKRIPLGSWQDCEISEILNENARQITLEQDLDEYILAFGHGTKQQYITQETIDTFNNNNKRRYRKKQHNSVTRVDIGIVSWIHKGYVTCHPDTRKTAYTTIIETLKKGWDRVDAQEYSTKVSDHYRDEWIVLRKKEMLVQEKILLKQIIFKLGMEQVATCHQRNKKSTPNDDTISLWVRTQALTQFKAIMKFDYTDTLTLAPVNTVTLEPVKNYPAKDTYIIVLFFLLSAYSWYTA